MQILRQRKLDQGRYPNQENLKRSAVRAALTGTGHYTGHTILPGLGQGGNSGSGKKVSVGQVKPGCRKGDIKEEERTCRDDLGGTLAKCHLFNLKGGGPGPQRGSG